ncbi:hypothetical protein SPAR_30601 [Streptomyces sparsogenes DSM 40356]|uniref:Uncharacterized protein n=1 Tax=Streptomyces sparsogenes DSM 40356 TaxID=1331668 RepID=A0A1R1SBP5_9ACTN|nr:hypothetical protein SPAR_30601 [Streptomyces sparsogenes DSM 40356]
MKYGSVDSLNVSVRCGCRPKDRQIRETVDCDKPISRAIARVDQCVESFGVDSSVRFTIAATCSSVTVRGPPDRGMSPKPAIRCPTNRFRQRPTACGVEPSWAATSLFDAPVAHARMIRHRKATQSGLLAYIHGLGFITIEPFDTEAALTAAGLLHAGYSWAGVHASHAARPSADFPAGRFLLTLTPDLYEGTGGPGGPPRPVAAASVGPWSGRALIERPPGEGPPAGIPGGPSRCTPERIEKST